MVSLAISTSSGWFTTYYSCVYLYSYATRTRCFHAYSYDTYILVVRCMRQNKDAVRSLVLLLVTGVRSDPKYWYAYDIICIYGS